MASPPQILGVTGTQIVFAVDGVLYQTSVANALTLTADQAQSLIASGDAIPQAESYLTQFPWLYTQDALVTEDLTNGINSQPITDENGNELWA
jgi:hypothetical protein